MSVVSGMYWRHVGSSWRTLCGQPSLSNLRVGFQLVSFLVPLLRVRATGSTDCGIVSFTLLSLSFFKPFVPPSFALGRGSHPCWSTGAMPLATADQQHSQQVSQSIYCLAPSCCIVSLSPYLSIEIVIIISIIHIPALRWIHWCCSSSFCFAKSSNACKAAQRKHCTGSVCGSSECAVVLPLAHHCNHHLHRFIWFHAIVRTAQLHLYFCSGLFYLGYHRHQNGATPSLRFTSLHLNTHFGRLSWLLFPRI